MENDPKEVVETTFSMYEPVFQFKLPFCKKLRFSIDREILKDVAVDELKKELKVRGNRSWF